MGADGLFPPPLGFGTTPSDFFALLTMLIEGFVIVFVTDSLREARSSAAKSALEAERARRATSFSLSLREELLALWAQKLVGPLAHVREATRSTRQAMQSGDRDAAMSALNKLEADIDLLQRTTQS